MKKNEVNSVEEAQKIYEINTEIKNKKIQHELEITKLEKEKKRLRIEKENQNREFEKSERLRKIQELDVSQKIFGNYISKIESGELNDVILNRMTFNGTDRIVLEYENATTSNKILSWPQSIQCANLNIFEEDVADSFGKKWFNLRYDIKNPLFEGYELVGTTSWDIFYVLIPIPHRGYVIYIKKKSPWYKIW